MSTPTIHDLLRTAAHQYNTELSAFEVLFRCFAFCEQHSMGVGAETDLLRLVANILGKELTPKWWPMTADRLEQLVEFPDFKSSNYDVHHFCAGCGERFSPLLTQVNIAGKVITRYEMTYDIHMRRIGTLLWQTRRARPKTVVAEGFGFRETVATRSFVAILCSKHITTKWIESLSALLGTNS